MRLHVNLAALCNAKRFAKAAAAQAMDRPTKFPTSFIEFCISARRRHSLCMYSLKVAPWLNIYNMQVKQPGWTLVNAQLK
jgi:hypothetical protein